MYQPPRLFTETDEVPVGLMIKVCPAPKKQNVWLVTVTVDRRPGERWSTRLYAQDYYSPFRIGSLVADRLHLLWETMAPCRKDVVTVLGQLERDLGGDEPF
jgi:hypothetical protein